MLPATTLRWACTRSTVLVQYSQLLHVDHQLASSTSMKSRSAKQLHEGMTVLCCLSGFRSCEVEPLLLLKVLLSHFLVPEQEHASFLRMSPIPDMWKSVRYCEWIGALCSMEVFLEMSHEKKLNTFQKFMLIRKELAHPYLSTSHFFSKKNH